MTLNDKNEDLIQEVWKNFSEQQHVFFATTEADQPRVRPVTLIRLQDELFVATDSNDAKIHQIKQNPKTEFCLLIEKGEKRGTIRAECKAWIVKDKDVKAEVYNKIFFIRKYFETPEDPSYALIKLEPVGFEYMKPGSVEAMKIKL
jgi:uncharacterized pyridoxamine 5'-phosphate oxidase family protein